MVRTRRLVSGIAAGLAVVLAGQIAAGTVGAADEAAEPADSLQARQENMAQVVAGLPTLEQVPAEVVDPDPAQLPAQPDVLPLEDVVEEDPDDGDAGGAEQAPDIVAESVVYDVGGRVPANVGGLELTLDPIAGEPAPETVEISVADPALTAQSGLTGVVVELADASQQLAPSSAVEVRLSYSQLADLGAGDWTSRLTLYQQVECGPTALPCRWVELDDVVNDPAQQTLTATVALTQGESLATGSAVTLAAGASSDGATGDWGATSLAPAAAWASGGSSGAFTWTYPMDVPDVPGGLVPNVALTYSSGVSDGRTPSTNNQASWVGEGFELTSSFIERKYLACMKDQDPVDGKAANNATKNTGDLCWGEDTATLVLNGNALELVKDADGGWRPKNDDGTRIEHETTGSEGAVETSLRDDDGEYWVVTTSDGLRYVFGSDLAPNKADATNSTWTVPVFGNHEGEKCNSALLAESMCRQAWRWNLRTVTDRSGNTMTYTYARERAAYRSYGLGNDKTVDYDTGGHLASITYGTRFDDLGGHALGKVVFDSALRCRAQSGGNCTQTKMRAHAGQWPDAPADLYCVPGASSSTCTVEQASPVFFNRYRLRTVTTYAYVGSQYEPVDSWQLVHGFVAPDGGRTNGQAASEILQLSSVARTGHGSQGSTMQLPPVQFGWTLHANRVDTANDGPSAMKRPRLTSIRSESGATTTVSYAATFGTGSTLTFPVNWDPKGQTRDKPDQFYKYVVTAVSDSGASSAGGERLVTGSDSVVTSYEYGDPFWATPTGPLVDEDEVTRSEFRGFAQVTTTSGDESAQSKTVTRFLQGRDRSVDAGPSPRTVPVADHERLAGMAYSQATFNASAMVSQTITVPGDLTSITASDGRKSTRIGAVATYVNTFTASGALERQTRAVTKFDSLSRPSQVDDDGAVWQSGGVLPPADETCTRQTYAAERTTSSGVRLAGLLTRAQVVAAACTDAATGLETLVSDTLTDYDAAGRTTATWQVDPSLDRTSGVLNHQTHAGYLRTSRVVQYDKFGRPLEVADAQDNRTFTQYNPPSTQGSVNGIVETVQVTAPAPSAGTPGSTTSTTLDPLRGSVLATVDANGRQTTAEYDALGRLLEVRYPQHANAANPSVQYQYTVKPNGLNGVVTRTLGADGVTQHLSSVVYDGLMRTIQTQTESQAAASSATSAAQRGRMVTHTLYDSAGRTSQVLGPWLATKAPAAGLVTTAGSYPSGTTYRYDAAGRVTDEITWRTNSSNPDYEKFRTVTVYDGSHTTVIPPQGGTAVTTVVDAQGRTTTLAQHRTRPAPAGFNARTVLDSQVVAATYEYDRSGNLVSFTDSGDLARGIAKNTWTYEYDFAGQQVAANDPDAGRTTTAYDTLGRTTAVTNGAGQTLSYTYDNLGRKLTVSDASGLRTSFTYDTAKDVDGNTVLGQLASSTRHTSGGEYVSQVLEYDHAYRAVRTKVSLPASGDLAGLTKREFVTEYGYTSDGQVQTVKLPQITQGGASGGGTKVLGAETVTTYYDAASRPQWMAGGFGWGTYVAESRRDDYGNLTALDLGNTYGAVASYRYDEVTQRLTGIAVKREQINGTDLNVAYTYDQAGNLTSATDTPGNLLLGQKPDRQCFTYDGLRRLTAAWTSKASTCGSEPTSTLEVAGAAPYWDTYGYDDLGNRRTLTARRAGSWGSWTSGATTTDTTYSYGQGQAGPHALTGTSTSVNGAAPTTAGYEYDAAGRQTARPGSGPLVWDGEGELTAVGAAGSRTSMVYDANGERLTRTDSSGTTVYLPGGQEIRVEDGEVVSAVRYYSFDGQTVAVRTGKGLGAVTSLVADLHGTALVAIANTTWTAAGVVKQYTDPFGAARGAGVDVPGERQFLDKTRDVSTGLTQVGARYYDETTGRFISVDPVLDLTNPQQWNAYVYANNNPTTWSDPTGLMISWDWLTDPIARAGRGTANWYSTWLEDSDGQSIIVNSLQSWGAGSADAVLGAVDLVTPGTIGRFGNPNTNSIYAYSDDFGEWTGLHILIGGNAGNAAKATSYVGNLGEKVLAEAAASLSARAAVETAANTAGDAAEIIQSTARAQAARGADELAGALSPAERAAMEAQPWLRNPMLGQAVHRNTASALDEAFPGRFQYSTRGPDFLDTLTGQRLELTTPGQVGAHLRRPGYEGVTMCTYVLPSC
ncbi:RHS repeat-associated core domain-containing protein [Cellulomonas palmilytica]|uniref:RHS repeat-associated core domain-containing protein n=1 Tax=Cellulomonas palmilytica TaxID=2608402 RepID=UPI001F1CFD1A|nr:RHS repeat-associated core domain-containing protein [Cellulomonas palmilytica]UJP39147.1 hypothetical protein F1D97_12420 [Cellulomonas palmilytica]